jgi:hypothetical protein
MREDHQKFFKEVCEFYDLLLRKCEPYAKVYQSLSLSTRAPEKPLTCRYIEGYYPQVGYNARVKDAASIIVIGSPSYNAMASRFTFLDFDESKPKHQDMITEAVKELKLKLKERGRASEYNDKLVVFASSESALEDPTFYQQAGIDFINKQMELIPVYRRTLNNLVGLNFNKDYYYEFDAGRITNAHYIIAGRFFFGVEESKNRRVFEMTRWKDFQMEKDEFERMKNLLENHEFKDISVNDHAEDSAHSLSNLSIEQLRELARIK